jgi:hypothetical protein
LRAQKEAEGVSHRVEHKSLPWGERIPKEEGK